MTVYYSHLPKTNDVGKSKILTADFQFFVDSRHYVIRKGFVWDGASIPYLLRWKYGTPFDPVHLVGGLVHDAIYADAVEEVMYEPNFCTDTALFTRLDADNIYFTLIRLGGSVFLRAAKEWMAVRFFGFSHWYDYKKGKVMKNLMKILGAAVAALLGLVVLAGCKSISFEKIDGEKIIRGSYYAYGIENNLEGLEITASPTNGVTVKINRSTMDMSSQHEKIVDASASAAGTVVGAAAAAMVKEGL